MLLSTAAPSFRWIRQRCPYVCSENPRSGSLRPPHTKSLQTFRPSSSFFCLLLLPVLSSIKKTALKLVNPFGIHRRESNGKLSKLSECFAFSSNVVSVLVLVIEFNLCHLPLPNTQNQLPQPKRRK